MRGDPSPSRSEGDAGAKRTQGVPRADGALVCPHYAGEMSEGQRGHTPALKIQPTNPQLTNRPKPTPTTTPMSI